MPWGALAFRRGWGGFSKLRVFGGSAALRREALRTRYEARPYKRVRTKRDASFLGRAAKGRSPRRPYGRPKSRLKPGGWQGRVGGDLTEMRRHAFAARGPKEPLEPWRCVEAGGAGTFWDRGDAECSFETYKITGQYKEPVRGRTQTHAGRSPGLTTSRPPVPSAHDQHRQQLRTPRLRHVAPRT